jgi:GNAT superfamily N-acetyltransferase
LRPITVSDITIAEVRTPLGEPWTRMTFPYYRGLLALVGTGQTTTRGQQPFACTATISGRPIGLALAQRAPAIPPTAEVVSLFVDPAARGQGIATAMLACLEDVALRHGITELSGTYMTDRPNVEAVERVLAKRGFEEPTVRMIVFKFAPEDARKCAWYRRARMPAGATIFKWSELTREELARLRQSQLERRWIHPKLEPWSADPNFDAISSVGMRKDGEIVGWVINHRLSPDMVTFSTAFMRPDLARMGASFPLYVASLEPLMGTGVLCTFVTNAEDFADMARFMLRRGAPFAQYSGQSLGVRKQLIST